MVERWVWKFGWYDLVQDRCNWKPVGATAARYILSKLVSLTECDATLLRETYCSQTSRWPKKTHLCLTYLQH